MIHITRENIETLLDSGKLFAAMRNGNWWQLRRNGKMQTWKKDARRFRLPVKAGLRAYHAIDETQLIRIDCENGDSVMALDTNSFRHVDDVPPKPKRTVRKQGCALLVT